MCLAIPLLERIIVEEDEEAVECHQCQEEERPPPQPSKERPALGATKAALVVNSAGPLECKRLSITWLRVVSNASDPFKNWTLSFSEKLLVSPTSAAAVTLFSMGQ